MRHTIMLPAILLIGFSAAVLSQDDEPASIERSVSVQEVLRPYSISEVREPCRDYDPLRRPHFGDTHVHTSLSFDARAQDTRNDPAAAYRFARGERMGIQPYEGDKALRSIQLGRSLDFTAVTDHAEFMGEVSMCMTPGSDGYWSPICMAYRYLPEQSYAVVAAYGLMAKKRWGFCGDGGQKCLDRAKSIWADVQVAAEEAYDRSEACDFTSFVAYEWTGTVGQGDNLHHNVVFKNAKVPAYAKSWVESNSSLELWDYLEQDCVEDTPGCDAISIPHNSNLSGGFMFESGRVSADQVPDGPLTASEAARRAHWEPIIEVMQHKGSSECDIRNGWTEDEFCGFEKLGYDSFGGKNTGMAEGGALDWLAWVFDQPLPETKLPDPNNYIRWALKEGLRQQAELGVNSLKFGMTSATDTHIAAPGLTSEKNHPGHGGAGMGSGDGVPKGLPDEREYSPGGLAVVWAEENTRDSIFAAMRRKEVYATSGTRPIVRVFGGWNYPAEICDSPDLVASGYAGGVPMGGDLPPRESAEQLSPKFLISAQQDVGDLGVPGTPLQRVQMIKGWYEDGELFEQVLDVAGGVNDATVDLATCEQHGDGHRNLCAVWQDHDFNADAPAFYYTRVLENPSCRWSQYICNDSGVDCADPATIGEGLEGCCAADHQPVIQERAWSSPIWYTPG